MTVRAFPLGFAAQPSRSWQEIAVTALLQWFNERHSVIGSSARLWLACRNTNLAALPVTIRSLTRAPSSMYWGIAPDASSPPIFHHERGR
jgi:hypothetical protein